MSRHRSLDGLRAVALALVVAYHLGIPGFGGGFVGVDVFFVLSGYLITSLLVDEHRRNGRVALRSFWVRRARRLWPLAWITFLLVALAGVVGIWSADQRATLGSQTAAAVAQVANWWQISHGGYVARFAAPSPLRHVWSLSVEEQFYLVWPLLLAGALVLAGRSPRLRRAPVVLVVVLAAASVGAGFLVDPVRAYLGTGTRAVALLAGAALALRWNRHPLAGPGTRSLVRVARTRWVLGVVGAAGAAVLAVLVVVARPEDPWLGRGGFALVAVCATAVVAATVGGPFPVRDALAAGPAVWLGERSYAVYLVHWPLIVALGPGRSRWVVAPLVVAVSVALAEVMRRTVEVPLVLRRVGTRPAALAGLAVMVVTAAALVVASPDAPTPSEEVAASLARVPDPVSEIAAGPVPTTVAASPGGPAAPAPPVTAPSPPTTCPPRSAPPTTFGGSDAFDLATIDEVADPTAAACGGRTRVLVLGDSTARGISNGLVALADPGLEVWDRTVLGCSFNQWNYGRRCPSWRAAWALDLLGVEPDVVVLYTSVPEELQGATSGSFLSPDAHRRRVGEITAAVRALSARGARVVLTTTPVPLRPNGLFYCRGRGSDSRCDPDWVDEWNRSVLEAVAATGATLLDVRSWIEARPATATTDRPDGLHLSGEALVEHARWLAPRLAAGRPAAAP